MAEYPPPQHILRDLRAESWLESETHAFAEIPVDDVVRDASGAVSLGALVTMIDLLCARVVFPAAHPHWIATADLSLATDKRPTEGKARAEAHLVRAGSKLITVSIDLHGAGSGFGTFVRIPREASDVDSDRRMAPIGERMSISLEGPPPTSPVTELMDLRSVDGAVELDRHDYVRNSFGNRAPVITADEVARVRSASAGRVDPYNIAELR